MNHRYTLAEIADVIQATIEGDENCVITSIAPLDMASEGHISFLHNPKYLKQLGTTKASAVIVTREASQSCPVNAVVVSDPHLAYAKTARLFAPRRYSEPGVHPTAIIGTDCEIHDDVSIGAHCVIGNGVKIGAKTVIDAGCVIGDNVCIGADCHLWSRVSIYNDVVLADRIICHSGVVIGSDGFGMANDRGQWLKIPQLGSVRIDADVEIGANTTIDRGALNDTIIETGVKLDNQVQIAHNVHIGAHTVIAGCAAIAGSCKIGRYCMIGGQTSINGHIEIADQVAIISASTVANSIKKPGVYGSSLVVQPVNQWRRNVVRFQTLDELAKRVSKLEKAYASHIH